MGFRGVYDRVKCRGLNSSQYASNMVFEALFYEDPGTAMLALRGLEFSM